MASQPMADRNQRGPCFGSSEMADLAAAQYPPLAQPGATQMGEISRTPTDAISPAFLAEAISGRNLSDDIATAAAWSLGESLFHAWQDKVAGALATAYVLYLRLLNGGDQILRAVLNHPQFPKRQRIHTKNRALIALQLVAKPSDDAQFKAASEYAAFLRCAASQQIQVDEFPERMSKVTLKECKAFVRAKARRGQECSKIVAAVGHSEPPASNSPATPAEAVVIAGAAGMAKSVPDDTTGADNAAARAIQHAVRILSTAGPARQIAAALKGTREVIAATDLDRAITFVKELKMALSSSVSSPPSIFDPSARKRI